jgi:hypothetical protein
VQPVGRERHNVQIVDAGEVGRVARADGSSLAIAVAAIIAS